MNATLEAIARALFQSWFVDFDPVCRNLDFTRSRGERGEEEKKFQPASSPLRASASPRDPFDALDPATAALFPGSFHVSQAGLDYRYLRTSFYRPARRSLCAGTNRYR